MYQVTPIPAFSDNYIWMLQNNEYDKNQVIVIDPGEAQCVIDALEKNNKQLFAIIVTHHHHDHTGGVNQLKSLYNVPVYGPKDCRFKGITHPLQEGDSIDLLGQRLQVKEVPGHTLDHISFLCHNTADAESVPQVFCGDTLFLAGCGRLFEGTMKQMFIAMKYFKSLPENTEVYCAHEYSISNLKFAEYVDPNNQDIKDTLSACIAKRERDIETLPSTIKQELLINPFLRCDQATIKDRLSTLEGLSNNDPIDELDIFSTLRTLKNNF